MRTSSDAEASDDDASSAPWSRETKKKKTKKKKKKTTKTKDKDKNLGVDAEPARFGPRGGGGGGGGAREVGRAAVARVGIGGRVLEEQRVAVGELPVLSAERRRRWHGALGVARPRGRERPTANKYCEGTIQRTLKRESKSAWNR